MEHSDQDIRMESPTPTEESDDSGDDYLALLGTEKREPESSTTNVAPPPAVLGACRSPTLTGVPPTESTPFPHPPPAGHPEDPQESTSEGGSDDSGDDYLATLLRHTGRNAEDVPPPVTSVATASRSPSLPAIATTDAQSTNCLASNGASMRTPSPESEDSADNYLHTIVSSTNLHHPTPPRNVLPLNRSIVPGDYVPDEPSLSSTDTPVVAAPTRSESSDEDDYLAQFAAKESTLGTPSVTAEGGAAQESDDEEEDYLQQFIQPPSSASRDASDLPSLPHQPATLPSAQISPGRGGRSITNRADEYLGNFNAPPPNEDAPSDDDDEGSAYLRQFEPIDQSYPSTLSPAKSPRRKKVKHAPKITGTSPLVKSGGRPQPSIISISSDSSPPSRLPRIFLPGGPQTCGDVLNEFTAMEDNPSWRIAYDSSASTPVRGNDLYSPPPSRWHVVSRYPTFRAPSPPPNDLIAPGSLPPPSPPLTQEELFVYHNEISNLSGMLYHEAADHLAASERQKSIAAESMLFSLSSLHQRLIRLSMQARPSADISQPPPRP